MKFTDNQIEIRPGHFTRSWQSCDYYLGRTKLFHERTYARALPPNRGKAATPAQLFWLSGGSGLGDSSHQWLPGGGTRAEMEVLAEKHGGHALEEFYAEEGADSYFLAFSDTEKALAFCRTSDFDRLATMEKLAE